MMTVNEVSKLTGVSIRTLQYYDTIGLLKPIEYTESGYRLYDDTSLERLQQILLFKELEFPLKEIKKIIDAPNFDRNKALEQQIELLTMKKEHLENLISFARGIKGIGVKYMDFKVFDTTKIDEYSKRAKEQWGQTSEFKEFEEKTKNWTKDDEATAANEFMQLFVEFGQMKEMNPADEHGLAGTSLRYARSLLSSASVSSFPKRKASLVCVLGAGLDGTRADPHSGIFSPCITPVFALEATSAPTTWPSLTRSVA